MPVASVAGRHVRSAFSDLTGAAPLPADSPRVRIKGPGKQPIPHMMDPRARRQRRASAPHGKRGIAIVYLAFGLVALLAITSLAVEVGRVQLAKSELQAAADAATRAACAQLSYGPSVARKVAAAAAAANKYDGAAVGLDNSKEIDFGNWDHTTKAFTLLNGSAESEANAVRVTIVRSTPLVFGQVVGMRSATVRAQSIASLTSNTGAYAIVGINSIKMSQDSFTDGYRSSAGAYLLATRTYTGSVASNGTISLADSADVYGDARWGPGKSISLLNGSKVWGLKAPLPKALSFPSVTLPAGVTDLGDINMTSGSSSLGGGTYVIGTLNMSGTAQHTWTGPVVLYFRNNYSITDGAVINTYQNKPANRKMYFLPTCKTGYWGGSHSCVADMYAPDTDFTVTGSADLYGRIVARSIAVSGTGGMHYDQDLPPIGENATTQSITQVQ
jgi:Flp pilus assembly protein TadG